MPPFLQFVIRRFMAVPISLLLITLALYGGVMLTPPEALALAARDIGGVVLLQATLTFIELGGDSVWGEMLALGRNWVIGPGGNLFRYWWVFLPPTLAVMLFGFAWNMLGDGLADMLDPHFT